MEKQTAIIVGVGTLAAAVVGGMGWKTLKARQAHKQQSLQEMELRKSRLKAQAEARETQVVHKELAPENLRASGDPVLSTLASMLVETTELPTAEETIQEILEHLPPTDVVEVIQAPQGEPVVSVSRPRVVVTPTDQTPMFWAAFEKNIRRPEVVALASKDFEKRDNELAKGYHLCIVDGVKGILHVTKSNVSAVMHLGGDKFVGISTSASRFGGTGLIGLKTEQAKNFLNGR